MYPGVHTPQHRVIWSFAKHFSGPGVSGVGVELGVYGGVLDILVAQPVFGKVNAQSRPRAQAADSGIERRCSIATVPLDI